MTPAQFHVLLDRLTRRLKATECSYVEWCPSKRRFSKLMELDASQGPIENIVPSGWTIVWTVDHRGRRGLRLMSTPEIQVSLAGPGYRSIAVIARNGAAIDIRLEPMPKVPAA